MNHVFVSVLSNSAPNSSNALYFRLNINMRILFPSKLQIGCRMIPRHSNKHTERQWYNFHERNDVIVSSISVYIPIDSSNTYFRKNVNGMIISTSKLQKVYRIFSQYSNECNKGQSYQFYERNYGFMSISVYLPTDSSNVYFSTLWSWE